MYEHLVTTVGEADGKLHRKTSKDNSLLFSQTDSLVRNRTF